MKNYLSDTLLCDDSKFIELEELESKLNKIYDYEAKGLIIRSRVRWLEEGEKSSKYFCNLENRSWQKKNISRIKDSEGNLIMDQTKILKEINQFYSDLYSCKDNSRITGDVGIGDHGNESLYDSIDIPKLSLEDKNLLEKPFTKQELFDVVKEMKMNKTPGFDGLPVEFYIIFLARYLRYAYEFLQFFIAKWFVVFFSKKWGYYNTSKR